MSQRPRKGPLAASASETITFYPLTLISSRSEGKFRNKITVASNERPILIFFILSRAIFAKLDFVQKDKKVKIFVFKQNFTHISLTNGEYLVENDSI